MTKKTRTIARMAVVPPASELSRIAHAAADSQDPQSVLISLLEQQSFTSRREVAYARGYLDAIQDSWNGIRQAEGVE